MTYKIFTRQITRQEASGEPSGATRTGATCIGHRGSVRQKSELGLPV